MFKVVIVDDEPLIVRSVKGQIEALDAEFQVIASANDGMTALQVIEQVRPDLVFIDIAMPVMDGFQLLERLREKENPVPVVILSGYQEFSYARKAISLGVLDYLIKPLNPVTLGEFLGKLKKKLAGTRKELQQGALTLFLRGNLEGARKQSVYTGEEKFYLVKICFGPYHFFRNNQFSVQEVQGMEGKLRAVVEENVGTGMEWFLLDEKEENEFLLLIRTEEGYGRKKVRQIYEGICKVLKPEEYITFVTSEQAVSLNLISKEKNSLESFLYHNAVFAKSSYLNSREENLSHPIEEPDYRLIKKLVEYQKKKELLNLIHQIISRMQEHHYTQAELTHVLKQILGLCSQGMAEHEMYFLLNLALCSSIDYNELEEKYGEMLLEYSGMEQDHPEEYQGAERAVQRIKEYLDAHCQEKIRIQDIAELYGFNYSYLCHLFRKHTGIAPNEYIIMKRMEYAKELLENQQEISIRELAGMSGYQDPYYFSRMFKSYTGISPSDYRKQFFKEEE